MVLKKLSTAPIKNTDGEILTDNETIDRWFAQHFEQLLNRLSAIDIEAINEIPQRTVNLSLDNLPSEHEVAKAIQELQSGKAAGPDGIPPEVFKHGDPALVKSFTEFMCLL